jgi:hypothetical protein
MPVTIDTANGPVVLKELWEDFKKGIDIQRGPYTEQSYLVPLWSQTDAVINAMMGSTSTAGGAGAIHVPGFRCPTSPNLTCMDAYTVGQAEYDVGDGGHPSFNLPIVKVVYGIRSWEQFATDDPGQFNSFMGNPGGPTTYAIHSMDFGTESVKIPGSAYKYKDPPNLPADVPMVRHLGVATLNVEVKKVSYLPSITIMKLIGKVNNALFFGAPKGRLLFLGGRTSKEFESDGTRVQNVSYTFKYRSADWNMFIRPDDGSFDFVQTDLLEMPYEYDDLTPLILLQGYAQMGTLPSDWP